MLDTVRNSLTSSQLRELEVFGNRINRFGVNFAVCNTESEFILLCETERFKSNREQLAKFAGRALDQDGIKSCSDDVPMLVQRFADMSTILTAVLKSSRNGNNCRQATAVVLIDLGNISSSPAPDAPCNTDDINPF